jgi:hypothetical protein
MAGPLRSQLHVDQLLSNIAVKYQNTEFIHDDVFPAVPVKKTTDLFRTYTKNWRIPETNRAPGSLAREHTWEIGNSSYALEKHALKEYIPDSAQDNYDITDLRADATIELTEKIMMRKEFQAAALFTTSSWSLGVSLAAGDTWVTGSAAPIALFDTAVSTVIANGGVKPNFGIIPLNSMNLLKNHTTVVDRVKYTSKEINFDIVGALIGLPDVLVPNMYYDAADLGATSNPTSIWKQTFAFVGYKPASPGFYQLSSGYMFQKDKPLVRRWREEERESEAIEVDTEFQFKVVASLTGYYINGTF